jgi:hypothetical protein
MAVAITMYISRFTGMFAPDSETAIGCNMRKPNNATNNGTYRVIAHPDAYGSCALGSLGAWLGSGASLLP